MDRERDKLDHPGPSSILAAIEANDVATVEALLSADASTALVENGSGRSGLHEACAERKDDARGIKQDIAIMLINARANVLAKDLAGLTALHLAAFEGLDRAVQVLVHAKASVHARDAELGKQQNSTACI